MFNASRTYWKKTPKLTSAKENLKRWLLIDFVFCHLKRTSFKASWLIMRKLTGVLYNLYTLTNKWVIFQTCFFNSIDVIFFYQKIFLMCVIFPNSIILFFIHVQPYTHILLDMNQSFHPLINWNFMKTILLTVMVFHRFRQKHNWFPLT